MGRHVLQVLVDSDINDRNSSFAFDSQTHSLD